MNNREGGHLAAGITSQDKLRQERDRYLAFAFAAGDALIELDDAHRVAFATGALQALAPAAAESNGESPLAGADFMALVAPHYRQRINSALRGLARRNRFGPLAIELLPPGGLPLHADLNAARLPEGNRVYISLRFLGPRRRQLPTKGNEVAKIAGLPDKNDFADIAAHALRASYTQPQPFNLSFVELEGLDELTGRLEETAASGFLLDIGRDLKAFSLEGEAATQVSGNKFSLIHEASKDVTALRDDIAGRARAVDPTGAGIDVISGTMRLEGDPVTHQENARALVYAINQFSRKNENFTLDEFTRQSQGSMAHTVKRISTLRSVISDSSFDIAYQPIKDLAQRQTHHYEALARFRASKEPSPYEEIVFAEDVGLIAEFDLAMCRRVAAKIVNTIGSGEEMRIAVNVSGRSLETPSFLDRLCKLIGGREELKGRLLFEITESAKVSDLEGAGRFLQTLRDKGFQVCLDDFGAGAAAFHYLRFLKVDFVKIDGVYVQDASRNGESRSFLQAIAGLCQDLSVEAIGEQVENQETVRLLMETGVRFGQGYLLGMPKAGLKGLGPIARRDIAAGRNVAG